MRMIQISSNPDETEFTGTVKTDDGIHSFTVNNNGSEPIIDWIDSMPEKNLSAEREIKVKIMKSHV